MVPRPHGQGRSVLTALIRHSTIVNAKCRTPSANRPTVLSMREPLEKPTMTADAVPSSDTTSKAGDGILQPVTS
jgi:hypothetical protein